MPKERQPFSSLQGQVVLQRASPAGRLHRPLSADLVQKIQNQDPVLV